MQRPLRDEPKVGNLNCLRLLRSGKCIPSSQSINRVFKLDCSVKGRDMLDLVGILKFDAFGGIGETVSWICDAHCSDYGTD